MMGAGSVSKSTSSTSIGPPTGRFGRSWRQRSALPGGAAGRRTWRRPAGHKRRPVGRCGHRARGRGGTDQHGRTRGCSRAFGLLRPPRTVVAPWGRSASWARLTVPWRPGSLSPPAGPNAHRGRWCTLSAAGKATLVDGVLSRAPPEPALLVGGAPRKHRGGDGQGAPRVGTGQHGSLSWSGRPSEGRLCRHLQRGARPRF